jgi:uncharacterized repeat protein (TIGR03803 family)
MLNQGIGRASSRDFRCQNWGKHVTKAASIALFAGVFGCAVVGTILAAGAATYSERVLYSFAGGTDGAEPYADLTVVQGTLYGTTPFGGIGVGCSREGCGTVFVLDPSTRTEKVLHSFCTLHNCPDGAEPIAGLIAANGILYGTTNAGGATGCNGYGCGTVFSIDPITGAEKVLYDFCSQSDCADGAGPTASLINAEGLLIGTTTEGGGTGCGGQGCGTVFSIDPNTGAEKVLYSFAGGTDGSLPYAGLIDVDRTLYGTTESGGNTGCSETSGCGTVFEIDLDTDTETVLYSFCSQSNCPDGAIPESNLIYLNGILYGTTNSGGSHDCDHACGTVFSVDPSTGSETVVHSFLGEGKDGQWPQAGLIVVSGKLVGTTSDGGIGAYAGGTVYSLDPKTGAEKVLYAFCELPNCADGYFPLAGVIDVNSAIFGTTSGGGTTCPEGAGCGTVFVLKTRR